MIFSVSRIKGIKGLGRVLFAVLSQGIIGVLSVFTTVYFPFVMGTEQYGYYQKFLFYFSYLNFFAFGVNDGISLVYTGKEIGDETKRLFRSIIRISCVYSLFFTVVIVIIGLFKGEENDSVILCLLGVSFLSVIVNGIAMGICLAYNKTVQYNISNVLQRGLFCVLALLIFFFHKHMSSSAELYFFVSLAFIVSNYVCTVYFVMVCKDSFVGGGVKWKLVITEIINLCKSGVIVAFSVLLTSLLPSLGRVIIENKVEINEYGIYSFYVTLLGVILSFANAVGIVFFPIFRNRLGGDVIRDYKKIVMAYECVGPIMFFAYVPIMLIIQNYMQAYAPGLRYFPFLFSMCYPLGKIQIILFPYCKTYRKEKEYGLVVFLMSVVQLIVLSVVYKISDSESIMSIFASLNVAIFLMIISKIVEKKIGIKRASIYDIITPFVFVLCAFFNYKLNFIISYTTYVVIVFIISLIIRRKKHGEIINNTKK